MSRYLPLHRSQYQSSQGNTVHPIDQTTNKSNKVMPVDEVLNNPNDKHRQHYHDKQRNQQNDKHVDKHDDKRVHHYSSKSVYQHDGKYQKKPYQTARMREIASHNDIIREIKEYEKMKKN